MTKLLTQSFLSWLPLALALCAVFLTIYAVVQQDYRMSANDPQIEIAHNAKDALLEGMNPSIYSSQLSVDMAQSLSPFFIVYDDAGAPLYGNGYLDQRLPTPPSGVFAYTKKFGEDRLTWQPKEGVRIAAVFVHYEKDGKEGFIMAGRSLQEVEVREQNLELMTIAALLGALIATFVVRLCIAFFRREQTFFS